MKICTGCKKLKFKTEFHIDNRAKSGLHSRCKLCLGIYRENNVIHKRQKDREYYYNNREKIIKYVSRYTTNRYRTDIVYKLKNNIRRRINHIIINNPKSGSALKDLGCSVEEFKLHLESRFQPGMSWDNYGYYGWHMDHIIPLDSFDLNNKEEFLKACHYTNLQPMWKDDNLKKGKKLS